MKSKLKKVLCLLLVLSASVVGFLPRVDGDVSVSEEEKTFTYYRDSLNQEYCIVTKNNKLEIIFAVNNNVTLKDVVIPEGITTLRGDCLFANAENVFIPASVTEMDMSVAYLNNVGSFTVDENNPNYCAVDGVLYTKDKKMVVICPRKSPDDIIEFDESAESVNEMWSFYPPDASYIIISENMKSIPCTLHFKSVYIDAVGDGWDRIESMINYNEKFATSGREGFCKEKPQIVYLPADCQYRELFDEKDLWLVVDGKNYSERHAKFAYRMACGIEEEQTDLRIYKETGERTVLFDENKNGTVDMQDVRTVLDKAEGRTVTDEEWAKFCDENAGDTDVVDRLIAIEAVGLKDGYTKGEQIKFTSRIINKSSRNLKIEAPTSSFGKAGTISAKLTDGNGKVLKNNYSDMLVNDAIYDGYLGVNEYIQLDFVYETKDFEPDRFNTDWSLKISFTYKDENNESHTVLKSYYPIVVDASGGTEYETEEITGGAAFLSDKAGEIKEYTNELSGYAVSLPIELYEYPGAKYYTSAINENYGYSMLASGAFVPSKVYTDENGKVWGYVSNSKLPNGAAWYCISSLPKQSNNLKGDANLDMRVNLLDAKLVLKAAIGITQLSGQAQINADVNDDGKVDLKDAKAVLKKALGI